MSMPKRIIQFIVLFATVLSFFPVSAHAEEYTSETDSFWDNYWASSAAFDNWPVNGLIGKALAHLHAGMSGNACAKSSDGWHHSDGYKDKGYDNRGKYYSCVCSECDDTFRVYTDELSAAYDSYVDDLPVNGIDSTGSFVWYPTAKNLCPWSWCDYSGYIRFAQDGTLYVRELPSTVDASPCYAYFSDNADGIGVDGYPSSAGIFRSNEFVTSLTFAVPVAGIYKCLDSFAFDVEMTSSSGSVSTYSANWSAGSMFHVEKGGIVYADKNLSISNGFYSAVHAKVYFPVFSVTPDVSALVGHDYSVDTRPAAIITVNDTTIINEDNSTFYNPVTEETYDMREWSYDYSDRSYHVTTNEGDTVTVTYGDENITINQGDTVYNVNYTIPETPVEPHEHNYVVSDSHDATCTVNGSVVYTCSECGLTYSETVPPLGHDWEFVETVAAVEDEEGNVVEEAYDLYRCRRCGEERQVPVGSAPASDGENATGFFSWLRKWLIAFKEWLGDKLDKLMGGGGVTNDLDIDDGGDGEEETDPADDPAHSHDDDDGAGWLLWFIRKLTKAGSRAVRGLAGVVFEEALDGVNDSIQGMKDTYGDSGGSVASGGFDIYDSESIWQ